MRLRSSANWPLAGYAAGAISLFFYFWHFAWPTLFNGFAPDDPMNIYLPWRMEWSRLLSGVAMFWGAVNRPVGGIFFRGLYELFGFEPLPFHLVLKALLLLNTFLVWRLATLLSGSSLTGWLAALVSAYHPNLAFLYYLPAYAFDVLAATFYLLALTLYIPAREHRQLGAARLILVLVLYILGLGSKEMAITLPAALLFYEALYHPPAWSRSGILKWIWDARGVWLTGLVAAAHLWGKLFLPGTVAELGAYTPNFAPAHVLSEQAKYLNQIFHVRWDRTLFTPTLAILIWLGAVAIGLLLKRRHLVWAAGLAAVTPLPIAVLEGRGGACLYLPLVGWALVVAALVTELGTALGRLPGLRRRPAIPALALLILGAVLFARMTHRQNRYNPEHMKIPPRDTWYVASEIRRVIPKVAPNTKAVVIADVNAGYDTGFIAELIWGDRSNHVWLQHQAHLPQGDIDGMDYVLEFGSDKRLRIVRGPK